MTTDPVSYVNHEIPCSVAEQDHQYREQMQRCDNHINDDYRLVEPAASWSSTHKHDKSDDEGPVHSKMQKMH